ncbi:MAG: bifunctional metallophosphatase/5'-nucleotidase [Saprospiraceae bacterium]
MKKHLLLCALFLLALVSCDPARRSSASSSDDGLIEIIFLQLNDVYEISPLSDNSGGLARVATLRKELLAKNPNTFTALAGDFISPSVIGTLRYEGKRIRGKQMVDCLNTLGLDWTVFGNHEFDYDYEDLQARIDESNFVWIGANARQVVASGSSKQFAQKRPDGSEEKCPDYVITEVKDADGTTVKIGVFGVLVTTGQKPFVAYTEPLAEAKRVHTELVGKTDIRIGLTHLDMADDIKLAGMLPDVPLIMGGHDHDNMFQRVGKTNVAKGDANARTVYVHTLRHNKKTGVTSVKSELRRIDGSIQPESAVAAVVAKWEKIKSESLASSGFDAEKTVTVLKEPLDCRETTVRHTQAPVGQMILNAMFSVSKTKPECGLVNGGSLRVDDVLSGTLTELDVVRMLPFGGGIAEVEMRGTLLQRTLDAGLANKGKGGYLHLSRIVRDEAGKRWVINNAPLEPKKTYRVVIADFLLTGNETGMDFLKTELTADGKGTTNPDVLRLTKADSKDKSDLRNDVRLALIQFLRKK